MAILVRKISRAKWPETICDIDHLSGDAISDLRTTNNTISLWRVNSEDDLPTAMLALSASSKSNNIEAVSIVWFSEDLIQGNIRLDKNSPGDTIISDLVDCHCDACEITYKSLGDIAKIIMTEIIEKNNCTRFTRSVVKKSLAEAYKQNRIAQEKCTENLLGEIVKAAKS